MSAADVSSSSAALPRWVREMTASMSKSRGYVVSSTAAGFVVKVHPATPRRGPPPWVAQEASAHPLRDERREGATEEQRNVPSARPSVLPELCATFEPWRTDRPLDATGVGTVVTSALDLV